ncbi:MAG: pilus assembly protein PilM [bacterium]|nr:pilus assembly protein PilM [bacterium]
MYYKRSKLERIVPMSERLMPPLFGLHISTQTIRVAELVEKPEGLRLGRYAERHIPYDSAYGEAPEARIELVKALRELKSSLGLDFVVASVPEERAYLFKTTVPVVPEREMRGNIELQLEENVPIPPSEAVFDYAIVPERHKEDHIDVTVTVLPRDIVKRTVELYGEAGISLSALRTVGDAITTAVIPRDDRRTVMIVNFGTRRTGIYVVSGGIVIFSASLNFGGSALTDGIEKHFGVTNEEALRIKRGEELKTDKERMELFFSLMNPVAALKDEMSRVIVYWHTHKDQMEERAPIERIILCGKDSTLTGLDEYLSITLGTPVELANVWQNVFSLDEYIPDVARSDSLSFAAAVGLALTHLVE